jgi:hypothetical protein
MSDSNLVVEIVQGDVLDFAADVLALKYAQHYYGSDQAVSDALVQSGVAAEELRPTPGNYALVDSSKVLRCPRVLFVGVPPLLEFGYMEIEKWAQRAIRIVAEQSSGTIHVAITLHGPGFGLDEIEALYAEIRGVLSAAREFAGAGLSIRVSIVERTTARLERLQAALSKVISESGSSSEPPTQPEPASNRGDEFDVALKAAITVRRPLKLKLRRPGHHAEDTAENEMMQGTHLQSATQVENKPRAFVAMPFSEEMEDVFYYGIQNPVREAGYICERVDQEAFTGDILQQVKMRIENSEIVIADLTGSNPNVYLEVGYAWGKGRPTVLVANKKGPLKFDVQGQRCLKYQTIKDLEKQLTTELKSLRAKPKEA